jgi:hypothetical protein
MAYFSLIRRGPHRNSRFQHFLVAAGTSLPGCYLATVRGYQDRLTDSVTDRIESDASNSSVVVCIRFLGSVFAESLPSNVTRDTVYRAVA